MLHIITVIVLSIIPEIAVYYSNHSIFRGTLKWVYNNLLFKNPEMSGYYDNHLILWGTLQKLHIIGA